MSYPLNSWLPLDLLRQVRALLRVRHGGTGNTHGWARGAIYAGWNATGGTLALGTVVKATGASGNFVEPTTAATDQAMGVVVGWLDGGEVLIEEDAPDAGPVAVLTSGVTQVLVATDVLQGDDATTSSTAGQADNAGTMAFGKYTGPGTAGLTAEVLILASGSGGSAAPIDATYLVTTSDPDLTNEVVVGATPGGELGGSWASPTVDTTHSGSSHAGIESAAEAYSDAALAGHTGDTTDAHDASAISIADAGGYFTATDVEAALQALAPVALEVACSNETGALTAGTSKVTFRMPFAMTLTAVRASLKTAQASGSIFTVDINEAGTTILSTKLTIDNTEKTSTTAATPPVISDASLADDAEMTVDIDSLGDGTAVGLKIALIGFRT